LLNSTSYLNDFIEETKKEEDEYSPEKMVKSEEKKKEKDKGKNYRLLTILESLLKPVLISSADDYNKSDPPKP
jgi:hypothetical protein